MKARALSGGARVGLRCLVCSRPALFWFALAATLLLGMSAEAEDGEEKANANAAHTIIHAGEVLAIPGDSVQRNKSIIVTDGRIAEIADGFVSPSYIGVQEARIVDLKSAFVLPGLIDSHVHMTSTPSATFQLDRIVQSDAHRAIWGAANARETLLAGFTTVRDTAGFRGNSYDSVFALRDGIRAGKIPGPRMLVAGQGVGSLGSQGDFLGYRSEVTDLFESRSMCSGPYECRDAVRYLVKRGADFIKMVPTGWATGRSEGDGDQTHMHEDEMRAIVETAHSFGLKVTAHATGVEGVKSALRAGVDSIEHGRALDSEAIALFKKNDAYLVPTLLVTKMFSNRRGGRVPGSARNLDRSEAPALSDLALEWFISARKAHNAGVKFAFGTDSAITPHGRNAEEFALLVEHVGMTPMEAIMTATVNAADHIGLADDVGKLSPGMAADIVAFSASPIDDIRALEHAIFVMRAGVVYKERP